MSMYELWDVVGVVGWQIQDGLDAQVRWAWISCALEETFEMCCKCEELMLQELLLFHGLIPLHSFFFIYFPPFICCFSAVLFKFIIYNVTSATAITWYKRIVLGGYWWYEELMVLAVLVWTSFFFLSSSHKPGTQPAMLTFSLSRNYPTSINNNTSRLKACITGPIRLVSEFACFLRTNIRRNLKSIRVPLNDYFW